MTMNFWLVKTFAAAVLDQVTPNLASLNTTQDAEDIRPVDTDCYQFEYFIIIIYMQVYTLTHNDTQIWTIFVNFIRLFCCILSEF